MSDIEEEIIGIIAKSLEVGEININSSVENTEEWDSLGHLSILVSLDKRFNGEVAGIKKMANIDSVKSILNVLKNNNLICYLIPIIFIILFSNIEYFLTLIVNYFDNF